MHAPIWLKFGIPIGGLKENTSISFGVNLITIERVISGFTHNAKANFCLSYRVNRFKEQSFVINIFTAKNL